MMLLGLVEAQLPPSTSSLFQNQTIPHGTLHDQPGTIIPLVGLGCASGVRTQHVASALQAGYRFFDTAQAYTWGYHEDEVGQAVREWGQQQTQPEASSSVWIQTKIHPEDLGYEATKQAVQVSLQRLQRTKLDSVLIHKPRCWEGACRKQPQGTWQDSWRALEELVDAGVVTAIGICDVDDRLLDELLQQRIKPHIIQNWMDPLHQNARIRRRCQDAGILYQAYSSLGTQWVHFRGYSVNPVLHNPTLMVLAETYNASVAQIVIQWGARHGVSMLPASTNPARQQQNINSFTFSLTAADMQAIDALDGQVPDKRQQRNGKDEGDDPNQVSIHFENKGTGSIDSYWINRDAKEVLVGSIQAGKSISLTSFHGHEFVFRRTADGSIVTRHVVAKDSGREQKHVVHSEL